ncbi:BCCT family transporter [Vibrio lentus]|nr:BCCT family transporter [Vibrio lentus]
MALVLRLKLQIRQRRVKRSKASTPGALLAVTRQLPMPMLISILFLILTTIFIVTTGDSMTYISVLLSVGETEPNAIIPYLLGCDGVTALILISHRFIMTFSAAIVHCYHSGTGV